MDSSGTPVSFAQWQTDTGETNSSAGNPDATFSTTMFVNPTSAVGDLHINTGASPATLALVSNVGVSVVGVTTDFDNAARSGTPDIGSDEFFIADTTAPTVVSSNRADADPTNAASVNFTVTFSESVTGVDTTDFTLTTTGGIVGASVTGVSGSGTTRTVTVNTGTGNGTIRLDVTDNDSIVDGSSNPLGGAGAGNGNFTTGQFYTVDTTVPTVVSSTRVNANPTNAASVDFTVTFSESVTGVDTTDFTLTTTGVAGASVTGVSGSGTTRTVTVNTGTGSGTIRLDVTDDDSIVDGIGNPLGGTGAGNGNFTTGEVYTVDKTGPTVVSSNRANADPTNAATVDFTVTFSESVTGVDTTDFTLTTTGVAGASVTGVSGSGTTRTVTVNTGTGSGTIRLDVTDDDSIVDGLGNPLGGVGAGNGNFTTGQFYTVDKTGPTVVSSNRANVNPTSAATVDFTVTFDESVTGVDTGDFTLNTTGVSGASITGVSGSGATRTVTVNTGTGNGTIRLDVTDNDSIVDGAGNPLGGVGAGNGDFTTGEVYTVDKTVPVVVSSNRANADPTNAASVDFTVTFSESVTGVDTTDFTLTTTGGIAGASVTGVSGSGTTRTVTVNTGTGSGTIRLDVTDNDSIIDSDSNPLGGTGAGNGNFTTGEVYTVDKTGPTVVSSNRANANPTNAATVDFTVTFSESVTGVDTTDFTLTTTGVAGASVTGVSGSGTTRTVTVNTGTGSGTIRLDVTDDDSIVDGLGNPLGGTGAGNGNFTTGEVYTVDKTGPTVVSSNRANANPTNAATVDFTVTFSESVTGVDTTDFTLTTTGVAGASVTGVSGSGTTRTVTVNTGTGSGTIRLDVTDDDSIVDGLGNPLGGTGAGNGNFTTGEVYTVDKTGPTVVSSNRANADPTSAATVDFTVTFDESVTGVDTTDFTLTTTGAIAGASVTGVSGSGATRTVTVNTGTGNGTIRLDVTDNDSIVDGLGNPLGGVGAGNGNFTTGQFYTVDKTAADTTPPTVVSSNRANADPTSAATVDFTVTFSESVTGVDTGDFTLFTTGVSGASITGVSGSGTTRTVTVNTGTGNGTIRLDVVDNDSIVDGAANPLGGAGAGNGNFTTGQFYTVDKSSPPQVPRTWVSEFGTDSGNCPRSAPCHTFNYAMTQTIAGGEVVALDSGGFGPTTITKSISLIGDYGIFAGISPVVLQGITIAAGNTDRVILRGLNLEGKGLGSNLNGIEATNFGSLYIENCKINGFGGGSSVGINLAPSGAVPHFVSIKNTEVRNNTTVGIAITGPGGAGSLNAVIEGSRIEKNGSEGIAAFQAVVTVRDSVVSSNTGVGIQITASGGSTITEVNVVESTVSHNGSHGLSTNAPASSGSSFRLTNTAIDNNGGCGVFQAAPAAVYTVGSNLINGNTGGNVCGGALTPAPAQ